MKYEISWWQLYVIMISVTLNSLTTFSPIMIARNPTSRDVWISIIIATVATTIVMLLVYTLSARFQGMVVYEYVGKIFGPYLGFLFNAAMIFFFLERAAVSLKQYGYFFVSAVYLRTPVPVFSVLLLLLALVAAVEGPEFIGRIGEISGLLMIGGLLFYMTFTLPETDLSLVKPVLAEGWRPVIEHAIAAFSILGEGIWVALIGIPYVNRIKQAVKTIFLASASHLVFYIAASVLIIGLFGIELIGLLSLPTLSAARIVSLGHIFERIEWLSLVMWLGAMGVRVAALLFAAALGVHTYWRNVTLTPPALICGALALIGSFFIFESASEVYRYFQYDNLARSALPLQLLPLLFLIVAVVRGVRNQSQPDERVIGR